VRDEGKPELLDKEEVRRYDESKCGKTCGTMYLVHMISPPIRLRMRIRQNRRIQIQSLR